MHEYIYKGFKISYELTAVNGCNEHRAQGYVYMENNPDLIKKFQTESFTYEDAQTEIKKLIQEYIDFEYKQFLEMRNEKH